MNQKQLLTPNGQYYYPNRLARSLGHPNPKKVVRVYRQTYPERVTKLENHKLATCTEPIVYAIDPNNLTHFTEFVNWHNSTYKPPKTFCPTCGHYGYTPQA